MMLTKPATVVPRSWRTPGPMLPANDTGTEYNLGSLYSYLPSARAVGNPATPIGPDGTVPVMLVPGDNDDGIRSARELSEDEVSTLLARFRSVAAAESDVDGS